MANPFIRRALTDSDRETVEKLKHIRAVLKDINQTDKDEISQVFCKGFDNAIQRHILDWYGLKL